MDIDIDILISAVQQRSPLYDTNTPLYYDRNKKKVLWNEIYSELNNKWTTYSSQEKTKFGKDVQRKWNSLRDCFRREVSYQKSLPLGNGIRKKKYKYYDALLFLLPFIRGTNTDSSVIQDFPYSEKHSDTSSDLGSTNRKRNKRSNNIKKEILSVFKEGNKAIKTTEQKSHQSKQIDDDEAFLMSLLPSIKDFTTDEKLKLRIEIMHTILRFKQTISDEVITVWVDSVEKLK